MSRLYAWIQRHPKIIDGLPAVFLIFVGEISVLAPSGLTSLNRWIAAPLPFLIAGPVIFRRRWPIGTFVFAGSFGVVAFFTGKIGFTAASSAYLLLLYTVAAYRARRFSIPAMLLVYVGALIQLAVSGAYKRSTADLSQCATKATDQLRIQCQSNLESAAPQVFSWTNLLLSAIFVGGLVGLFWVAGDSMRYRREYYVRLEDRAQRLERERDAQAQIAAAAERARIARELHDVVAHNVSVMVVQADGAGYALDADPEAAREALLAISQTGRTALTEMRRMLGVLRSAEDVGAYAPQPGIEQLGDLLEQVRAAGLPVTLTVEGVPREMPTGLALAVYRIIQESLTNTRKHGGPDVRATVGLMYTDDCLVLRITDDGRGAAAPGDGAGHGLVGMRERVLVFGGTLAAGPRPAGGYAVEAILPFTEAEAEAEAEAGAKAAAGGSGGAERRGGADAVRGSGGSGHLGQAVRPVHAEAPAHADDRDKTRARDTRAGRTVPTPATTRGEL